MQAFPPDALQDPNYLYDPFDTLFFSLDDSAHEYLSPHDIMEAYNTIYLRLRASADQLASSAAHCPPALQFFKNDHEAVSAVLTRDISRALSLPLGLSRNFGTSTDPSRSEPEESSVAARYAKDSSTICHFALRALAQLFQSIAICDILPDDDILKLLDIVITILKTPILPSFNGSKTANDLAEALHRIIDLLSSITATDLIIDALEIAAGLLASHADIFLHPLCKVLPSVLFHITAPPPRLRHQATRTLSQYCSLIVKLAPNPSSYLLKQSVAGHVQSFLEVQTSPTSDHFIYEGLPKLLGDALRAANPYQIGQGAVWALTVVTCLAVLHGQSIFYRPCAVQLCFETAGGVLNHSHPIRDLHPHSWRCFIWTFGYLKGRLDEDMMAGARSDLEGKVEGALGVVKQELGHGLGIALLRTLLGSSPPDFGSDFGQHSGSWSILKAISIVEDMLQHQDRDLQSAGIEAFTRLFIRFDLEPLDVEAGNPGKSLLLALLDGTMLSLDENQLSEVLRSTSDDGLKDVRQLSPVEVATCWDTLAACWAMAVHCQRESNTSTMIDGKLLLSWKVLVSAKLQSEVDSQPPAFYLDVASIILRFLPSTHQGNSTRNARISGQWQSLHIMKQLWDAVTECFLSTDLRAVALAIIPPLLNFSFDPADDLVKSSWRALCTGLLIVASPCSMSKEPSSGNHIKSVKELRRQLWAALASVWGTSNDQKGRADTVSFLVMPFSYWPLSDAEVELWQAVLERGVMRQSSPADAVSVVECVSQCLMSDELRLSLHRRVNFAISLVCVVTQEDTCPFPCGAFSFVDATLVASYPSSEHTLLSLKLLGMLHHQVRSTPHSLLISLLDCLEKSLCLWFSDAQAIASVEDFNTIIMPLYKSILLRLKDSTPSMSILFAATPLLVSVFNRVPSPALGPIAFMEFFEDIFLRHGRPAHDYPKELLFCARCCSETYGGELLPGLAESGLQSQSQSISLGHEVGSVSLSMRSTGERSGAGHQGILGKRNRSFSLRSRSSSPLADALPVSKKRKLDDTPVPAQRGATRRSDTPRKVIFDCVEVETYKSVYRRYATANKMQRNTLATGKVKQKEECPALRTEDSSIRETDLGALQITEMREPSTEEIGTSHLIQRWDTLTHRTVPETPGASYIAPDLPTISGDSSKPLTIYPARPSLSTPTSSPLRGYESCDKSELPLTAERPLTQAYSSLTPLNALRQAYDMLTSDVLSQMQIPELAAASLIVEKLGIAVNAKLRKRLIDGTE